MTLNNLIMASFQLIRFNPGGRVIGKRQGSYKSVSFQLIRFNPGGRDEVEAISEATPYVFPTNPL